MPSDRFLSLPFEQQIGQFFFIGLPGKTIDSEARELIEEIKPGGIILFGRNVESPEQVRKWLDDARALVPTPPLCGLDPEGELVDRVRVVMVSHGGFPNIDIKRGTTGGLVEPASISPNIVSQLLRKELGYRHLVVTDDLEMGAISKHCEIEEASVKAFKAGEDMLLICATPETIRRGYHALLAAAQNKQIKERRIQ